MFTHIAPFFFLCAVVFFVSFLGLIDIRGEEMIHITLRGFRACPAVGRLMGCDRQRARRGGRARGSTVVNQHVSLE